MRAKGLRRAQMYTIMKVSEEPRKCSDTSGAMQVISAAPKRMRKKKSAVLPLNEPSSSALQ